VITVSLYLGLAEGANDQNNTRYDLFIVETPVVQSEDMQESGGVLMANKAGQKYQCSVTDAPVPAPSDTADSADSEAKRRSMAAVAAGPCILATGLDWWQYEVCVGRQVKQWGPGGVFHLLGQHSPDLDIWQPSFSQHYGNGSSCEDGSSRQAEVRFVCDGSAVVEYIGNIVEVERCQYRIQIQSSRMCYPPWIPDTQHYGAQSSIVCQPLLNSKEMEEYTSLKSWENKLELLETEEKIVEFSFDLMMEKLGDILEKAIIGSDDTSMNIVNNKTNHESLSIQLTSLPWVEGTHNATILHLMKEESLGRVKEEDIEDHRFSEQNYHFSLNKKK